MNIYRIFIYVTLLALASFSFYMFNFNRQNLETYNLNLTKKISGELQSYNKQENKRAVYFNFKLRGLSTVFVIPAPEWKAFDFESFKFDIAEGDFLELTIPNGKSNEKTINVFQIKSGNKYFIDFEKMKQERKTEMVLSFILGIACIIGLVHHYYRPWM